MRYAILSVAAGAALTFALVSVVTFALVRQKGAES